MFLQEECPTDEQSIDVNIRLIRNEIHNEHRFEEITIVVVDYAMPDLNGIEFCRRLKQKNSAIKIIMLTGEADYDLAVEAFNDGLIEKFLLKSNPEVTEILLSEISALQRHYFQDLSETVINSFVSRPELPASCLKDPVFIRFFNQLCEKHKLVEYYMTEGSGSFLFLNAVGKPSLLAVASEALMKEITEIAEDSEVPVAPAILDALRKREKVLYLHSESDLNTSPAEWSPYLHTAKKLEGKAVYYCAYIDNPKMYDLQLEKVISYKTYLERL
jgi:CheY-like chemotaxis protein